MKTPLCCHFCKVRGGRRSVTVSSQSFQLELAKVFICFLKEHQVVPTKQSLLSCSAKVEAIWISTRSFSSFSNSNNFHNEPAVCCFHSTNGGRDPPQPLVGGLRFSSFWYYRAPPCWSGHSVPLETTCMSTLPPFLLLSILVAKY